MCIKASHFSPVGYTLYSFIGTVIEQGAIFIILYYWLPQIGIEAPWWGIVLVMGAFLAYSIYTYSKGRAAMRRNPVVAPETVIGCRGRVATSIDPRGYVRIKGELWKAQSQYRLEVNDEVVVVAVEGIQLIVTPADRNSRESLTRKH
jgi:membrane-bound serine protease (ClpP class)